MVECNFYALPNNLRVYGSYSECVTLRIFSPIAEIWLFTLMWTELMQRVRISEATVTRGRNQLCCFREQPNISQQVSGNRPSDEDAWACSDAKYVL